MEPFGSLHDAQLAIVSAAQDYLKRHAPGVEAVVDLETVQGSHARVGVRAASGGATPAHAFLALKGGRWGVVLFGTGFAPGDYDRVGVPAAVRL